MFVRLLAGVLAVWRVTHLLHAEDGPGDVIRLLREHAGTGFWGTLLNCFFCLSFWIAFPIALLTGRTWKEYLLLWPGLSAGAILLDEFMTGEEQPLDVIYVEDEEY